MCAIMEYAYSSVGKKGTNGTLAGYGYTWFALENAQVFAAERYYLLGSAMVTVG